MSNYTFTNLTVTVEAKNANEAYSKLCKMLSVHGVEYTTDEYYKEGDFESISTETLFPEE